ncbi:MAG: peptidylprolyl isomerase [Bacteroidales bacterium]|nr:peptidylprolyl isomerase [Bacteroidales bacterium]MBN2699210.1 peptidylprolyl isomerase [Bacteroidales bacterium]
MKTSSSIITALFITLFFSASLFSRETNSPARIKIETTLGDIIILLYDETPLHRDNMIKLADQGFYDNLLFHRVISSFMIQGGDPHSAGAASGQRLGTGGPGYTVPAEFNRAYFHKKGALAAARQGDNVNPEKRSSGSQFYIVQGRVLSVDELKMMEQRGIHEPFTEEEIKAYTTIGGTPHLDGAYTVFGEVVEGFEVIDRIASVPTDPYDRPQDDIVFKISVIR